MADAGAVADVPAPAGAVDGSISADDVVDDELCDDAADDVVGDDDDDDDKSLRCDCVFGGG